MEAQSTRSYRGLLCGNALILLLSLRLAHGQQFSEIRAEIDLVCYRGDDTNAAAKAKPKTITVVCITGTNEWRIDDDSVRDSLNRWFFDGTNVYHSLQITKPMSEEMRERIAQTTPLAQVPFDIARSNITINVWPSPAGHPLGDAAENIAWLAFCSGPYLKFDGRLVPLPLEILRHTRDRFAYTDKTETFNDGFGLPRSVDLYLSKALFLTSETEFDKEYSFGDRYTEWTKKTSEEIPDGAQMFHYAITESTNFLGWNFPMKFECNQNARKFEQNGDWFWQGKGRLKSIRASARPEGLFDTSLNQTVVDWRFKDALMYTWTNNFLSPTNDQFLQEKYAKRVAQLERMRKKEAGGREPAKK